MTATDSLTVEVPDIGDFDQVPVIEILVSPGDEVALDDPLLTLESDKATMDVPAPFAGTVKEVHVQIGDRVKQGSLLFTMQTAGDETAPATSKASQAASAGAPSEAHAPDSISSASQAEPEPERGSPSQPPPSHAGNGSAATEAPGASQTADGSGQIYASPSVRRLARQLGVELSQVSGSGRKGRIMKADVEGFQNRARLRLRRPVLVWVWPCPPGRRWSSRSSGPSSAWRARASSASRRPCWPATG